MALLHDRQTAGRHWRSARVLALLAGAAAWLVVAACSTTRAPVAGSASPPTASAIAATASSLGAVEAHLRTALAASAAIIEHDGGLVRLRFPARVAFTPDQSTLLPDFTASLDELARILRGQDQLAITVSVYTDATGSEAYNQQFTEQRAGVIASYLAGHGIAAHRIIARGGGESAPLPAENTPEGRDLNRRVEFSISALSS